MSYLGIHSHLASEVFNTPLLIESGKLAVILRVLGPRLGCEGAVVTVPGPAHTARFEDKTELVRVDDGEERSIYSVNDNGIAVIDINGSLVNRTSGMDALSGLQSYEQLGDVLNQAVSSSDVRGIMLRVNSPGGQVSGLVTLANSIRDAAKSKPIWAAVDDYAYSAAYWLTSAASKVYISETGGVGSIGVIAEHIDESKAEEMAGYKFETLYVGAKKNDFSPHEPLNDSARTDLMSHMDDIYKSFVNSVSQNRGMARKAVRGTEAGVYYGQKGIDIGLADELGSFSQAMGAFEVYLNRPSAKRLRPAKEKPAQSLETSAFPHHSTIDIRENDEGDDSAQPFDLPRISGYLAPFNQHSLDLGGFVEVIKPGAFKKSINEADIHLYFDHEPRIVLGRNKSGTLELEEDEYGVHFLNYPPETQTVRDLVFVPIQRGDIDQCSFAFLPVRQSWSKTEDGQLLRTLHEVKLFHGSILPKGAYPGTKVELNMGEDDDIDFLALNAIHAKQRLGLDLTDEEGSYLEFAMHRLSSVSVQPLVAPVTNHPATDVKPSRRVLVDNQSVGNQPIDNQYVNRLETLQLRLRLARLGRVR